MIAPIDVQAMAACLQGILGQNGLRFTSLMDHQHNVLEDAYDLVLEGECEAGHELRGMVRMDGWRVRRIGGALPQASLVGMFIEKARGLASKGCEVCQVTPPAVLCSQCGAPMLFAEVVVPMQFFCASCDRSVVP